MLVICGIVYVIFADSTLQSWNQPELFNSKNEEAQIVDLPTDKEKQQKNKKISDSDKDISQPHPHEQK